MDNHKKAVMMKRIERTMKNLQKNNMEAYYVDRKEEVAGLVSQLLKEGDLVVTGGSVTLNETGVIELLRSGRYDFRDRHLPNLTPEQVREVFLAAFHADTYLCSANAITEEGELYNVDGNSNRVAALLFGPKSVIVVAGINKIVRNLEEAVQRVKTVAAPCNCHRLGNSTYCHETGYCRGAGSDCMTAGCESDSRICCNYVVSAKQRHKGRIKVILVGEELGY